MKSPNSNPGKQNPTVYVAAAALILASASFVAFRGGPEETADITRAQVEVVLNDGGVKEPPVVVEPIGDLSIPDLVPFVGPELQPIVDLKDLARKARDGSLEARDLLWKIIFDAQEACSYPPYCDSADVADDILKQAGLSSIEFRIMSTAHNLNRSIKTLSDPELFEEEASNFQGLRGENAEKPSDNVVTEGLFFDISNCLFSQADELNPFDPLFLDIVGKDRAELQDLVRESIEAIKKFGFWVNYEDGGAEGVIAKLKKAYSID